MPRVASTVVTETRPLDHVFDPVYTVSGQNAQRPMYRQPQPPRIDPVLARAAQLAGLPREAAATSQTRHPPQAALRQTLNQSVGGIDRHKFFRRPLRPYMQTVPPEVLLAPEAAGRFEALPDIGAQQAQANEPSHRTQSIQTMFRESYAQTNPYTPDYFIRPSASGETDEQPEILQLANLTFANGGLPAGLDEVKMIERMRQKRDFERNLPRLTDEKSFAIRKKLMKEQELREWKERETQIQKLEEERLELMVQKIRERDEILNAKHEERVELLRQQHHEQRDHAVNSIHQRRIKTLRKVAKERGRVEHKHEKRDIIGEYADFGSRAYAPVRREGKVPYSAAGLEWDTPLLSTFQGLEELERSIPKSLRMPPTMKPGKVVASKFANRKGQHIAAQLQKMDTLLETAKTKTGRPLSPITNIYKNFQPLVRPETPQIPVVHTEQEQAIILLQRLLRGRAAQNMMYTGKEKRLELIRELRLDKAAQAAHQQKSSAQKVNQCSQTEMVDIGVDAVQGHVIARTLDFLIKEARRVKEEKRISEVKELAERTRRIREAEEAGRRQAETMLRSKEEQQHGEVMHVHGETTDFFMQEIQAGAVTAVASRNAHAYASERVAREKAEAADPNRQVDTQGLNVTQDEMEVRRIVADWLLPEVQKARVREIDEHRDLRHQDAAIHSASTALSQAATKLPRS